MSAPFNPKLAPHELPRETLVDLWDRTVDAHARLSKTWSEAVSERYGADTASAIADEGWPLRRRGANARQLFFDDLRFIVAATELKPDMLTVASRDQAETPEELVTNRGWFQLLVAGSRLATRDSAARTRGPAWVGHPGRMRGLARGKGIDVGFKVLLGAWHRAQGAHAIDVDTAAFEQKVRNELDRETLGLLWNYAALAYMLTTDRWYGGVKRRHGERAAQDLEKEVWIDRGAAEHDLQIGQEALGVSGDDVESLLRSFQFAPGEVGILNVELELRDRTHGTLTHHACPALDRFEHYDDTRLKHCCDICIAGMPISGEMLNPRIRCKPLKLPPRRDADDIACKWEYELVDQS